LLTELLGVLHVTPPAGEHAVTTTSASAIVSQRLAEASPPQVALSKNKGIMGGICHTAVPKRSSRDYSNDLMVIVHYRLQQK